LHHDYRDFTLQHDPEWETIDSYKGVGVYDNGVLFWKAYGKHYSEDGYYYGQKCSALNSRSVSISIRNDIACRMSSATQKISFDENVPQGGLNARRGLLQFRNAQ